MESTVIHPVGEYTRILQANIAEKLSRQPIYEICIEAERMPRLIRMVRWWDQDVVNETEE